MAKFARPIAFRWEVTPFLRTEPTVGAGSFGRWAALKLFVRSRLAYTEGANTDQVRGWKMLMQNKVVFITGASGGLGATVTQRFLATGAAVIGSSRRIAAAEFPQPNFSPLPVDFTQPDAIRGAVASIIAKFGKLDVLIHVLGGFAAGSIAETSDATWQQMQNLNLNAAFYVLRETIPHLRKSGAGRIVAVGSLAASEPHPGLGAYVASKAALVALVRTVALENRDAGLTANVALPGTMDTPSNRKAMPNADFSRWAQPADVAEVILWLAGEQAGQITGATIPVPDKNA